ncbi:hypothetical protein MIMGU_mgv11b018037mg [Erythranthe guttata]|uniref:Disease resistance R13L4/SHOC-2-like LRR domain-containing protein n=1 Tax=Erythranthe guttata TaxID=4155 RepID=A0A022QDF9_ERYGU|nr:hypothetical protein MIMGU_mgv11b018037mg [Erythranthe guttata]
MLIAVSSRSYYWALSFRLCTNENSKGQDFYNIHDVISMIRLISDMQHARVIDLSHMGIDNVPDSICEMKRLRLLNLSGNPFSKLPNLFWQLNDLETLKLETCHRLKQWPNDMKNVVSLQHLLISVCFLENMPLEFGKFVNLQMLYALIVGKSNNNHGIQQLKDLDMLIGSICIVNLENVRSHDICKGS